MGAVPSTPRWTGGARPQDTTEYLIATFVGEKSFPISSDFWQKLLELPLNLQWPSHRVLQACELFGSFRQISLRSFVLSLFLFCLFIYFFALILTNSAGKISGILEFQFWVRNFGVFLRVFQGFCRVLVFITL